MKIKNSQINSESNLIIGMNITTNVFHIINQIIAAFLSVFSFYVVYFKKHNVRIYILVLHISIACVILLLKFITIEPKMVWKIAIIVFAILNVVLLFLFTKNLEWEKESVNTYRAISVTSSSILLIIMLGIMYLYYIKKNKKLRSYSHHYFIISSAVLILALLVLCIYLYFDENIDYKSCLYYGVNPYGDNNNEDNNNEDNNNEDNNNEDKDSVTSDSSWIRDVAIHEDTSPYPW